MVAVKSTAPSKAHPRSSTSRRKPGRPQGSRIGPTLEAVRHSLAICAALAYVTSDALKAGGSDCVAAAVVLRRAVGDELERQIEDIDWLLAHGRGIERKS